VIARYSLSLPHAQSYSECRHAVIVVEIALLDLLAVLKIDGDVV
jgi:hypothetical protein